MLAGAVAAGLVGADELGADGDLDGVAHDGDLDLTAPVGVADPELAPAKDTFPEESTLRVTDAAVGVGRGGRGTGIEADFVAIRSASGPHIL